jgi:hypothetical protein
MLLYPVLSLSDSPLRLRHVIPIPPVAVRQDHVLSDSVCSGPNPASFAIHFASTFTLPIEGNIIMTAGCFWPPPFAQTACSKEEIHTFELATPQFNPFMKFVAFFAFLFLSVSGFADDLADAKKAFATFLAYQKSDDPRTMDLYAPDCVITLTKTDGKHSIPIVISGEPWRKVLAAALARKSGNQDTYEDVKFAEIGESVTVTATILYNQNGKRGPFFALYARNKEGLFVIKELKATVPVEHLEVDSRPPDNRPPPKWKSKDGNVTFNHDYSQWEFYPTEKGFMAFHKKDRTLVAVLVDQIDATTSVPEAAASFKKKFAEDAKKGFESNQIKWIKEPVNRMVFYPFVVDYEIPSATKLGYGRFLMSTDALYIVFLSGNPTDPSAREDAIAFERSITILGKDH